MILWIALIVFTVAAAASAVLLAHLYRRAIAESEQTFSNIALVLANHSENTFRSVELLQDGLVAMVHDLNIKSVEQFNELLTTSQVNDLMHARTSSLPQVEAVFFTNAQGLTIASTRSWPQAVFSIANRPHFSVLRDNPELTSYIAPPAANVQTGTRNMYVSRSIVTDDGTFLGIVGVGLSVDRFESFLGRIALGAQSAIALWRRDGILMARHPPVPGVDGAPSMEAREPNFLQVLRRSNAGVYRHVSMVDRIERVTATRALAGYPVVVTVSRGVQEILILWRQQVAYFAAALMLVALVILAFVFLGIRFLRNRDALERTRTELGVLEEHKRGAERIAFLALHDPLTGLANRTLFGRKLDEAAARARRGQTCAVHCIDLDHFKDVNDTLGHPMGDMLLREVTKRLKAVVRETDTIARLGGDEFAIVQTGVENPQDPALLAQRVIEAIAAPYSLDGHHILIGVSIGIAVAPGDGSETDVLLSNADLALYRSKAKGRGRFSFFEPEMNAHAQLRLTQLADLRRALSDGDFALLYQPQVSLPSRQVVGFEALLRWHHPERGVILPDRFITQAEESGLIVPIGLWALREACTQASAWPGGLRVAVNISAVQIGSPNFVESVTEILYDTKLHGSRLELEVTETVLLRDTDATLATLHRLRDLGISIALDDFGTGYSSLGYLQRFPFDRVKLDRSFIIQLGHARTSNAIVRCVIDLCRAITISVTAEGIETEEQCRILASEGCDEAQGYLFGEPSSAGGISPLLGRPRIDSLSLS